MSSIPKHLREELIADGIDPNTLKEAAKPNPEVTDDQKPKVEPENNQPANLKSETQEAQQDAVIQGEILETSVKEEKPAPKDILDSLTTREQKRDAKKIEIEAQELNNLRAAQGRVQQLQRDVEQERAANRELVDYIGQLEAALNGKQPEEAAQPQGGVDNSWQRETDQTIAEVNKRLEEQQFRSFKLEAKSRVPSFDRIVNSVEWEDFLQRKVPGTNRTFKDEVSIAVSNMDSDGVVGVFDYFKETLSQGGSAQSQNPSRPKNSLSDLAQPDKTAAAKPAQPQFLYKESDVDKWQQQHMRGKITSEAYAANTNAFNKALREGKVQLNA